MVNECIRQKCEFYENHNLTTCQPYILICGPLCKIENIFVIIHKTKIDCGQSIFQALHICFKSFHVFQLKYSYCCAYVWSFMHHCLYKLDYEIKNTVGRNKCNDLLKKLEQIELSMNQVKY